MICRFTNFLLILYLILKDGICLITDLLFDIVKKLDCDTRVNVYIGITGLLIAIVIFAAEIITSKRIEINKKLILEKTKIVESIKKMIIALAVIWIGGLITQEYSKIAYVFTQIIIDVTIGYSMIEIFKLFLEVIKLNTNQDYFDDELEKYIYDKVEENIGKREKQKNILKRQNDEFMNFIKQSEVFEYEPYPLNLENEYDTLQSNKYGYIYSYNYYMLNKIEENLKVKTKRNINSDKELNITVENEPKIYISKKIGDKCGQGFAIAYYKNVEKELINIINKAIVIDNKNKVSSDNEISKIIDDVFALANQKPFNMDEDNLLINLYEFLCKNKYESIIATYLEKIYYLHREFSKDIEKNKILSDFLNKLMISSFRNDRYEDFSKLNKYITGLYINRMNFEGADLKYVAYRYANDVFIFNNYSIKRKKDIRYYDVIMAGLLLIIKEYLKRHNIDPIMVLFDNIHFDKNNYYIEKEMDEFEIVNFQFVIAIIYFILYVYKNEENKNKNFEFINDFSKLIDTLHSKLWELYDLWDTIKKFNNYSEKKSEIQHIVKNVDLDSESHKYKNSWSWTPINIEEALKSIIYMFGINYFNIEQIKEEEIKREEKYKYENLLKLFENDSYKELADKYQYEEKFKDSAIKLLTRIIEIADKKEKEYELNAEIDEEKRNRFKELIIKNSKVKSNIEELIYNIGNIKYSEEKLKRVFGISELIPRNWFIKDEYNNVYIDNVAEDYGKAFQRGIKKEIINYIINNSKEKEGTLNEIINNIPNTNDYILIANESKIYNLNYKYADKYIDIENKKLTVIPTFDIEEIVLINKKALPIIEWCQFDNSYNANNIIDGIYIEITDCAEKEELRKNIIKENSWLKEKGNEEEQDKYLKTKCDFKVFKSYKITESLNKEIYIIKNQSD
ncbi:MAG: hypothetical protein IJK18_06170 [Clostridia bacterium]|nr:hypothetical protein [Clostridia bacterium]